MRVFAKTDNINLACVLDGRLPENGNEIAVDRMHADNVDMKVGDTIRVGGEKFEVVGLIAYVNYSTLHEKTTDLMFDAINFATDDMGSDMSMGGVILDIQRIKKIPMDQALKNVE